MNVNAMIYLKDINTTEKINVSGGQGLDPGKDGERHVESMYPCSRINALRNLFPREGILYL